MDKYVKKYLSKDEANFLKVDRNPWEASASGVGYNGGWDDNSGYERGSNWNDSDSHGLVNRLPDEAGDSVHQRLAGLIDGQRDMGSGSKLLGGGGPVSDNKVGGVGDGRPRFAPKTGPQGNMKGWK